MTIDTLWSKTSQYLILIEEGGPESFRMIANARQQLLDLGKVGEIGSHIVAPVIITNCV
jgi:ribosomal protein RSM22 (predicted rRNA methylase)